jgi:predicted dehydrogenase
LAAALKETGAEVVFDCTVPAAHRSVGMTALDAGCHVFGEKPLAASMEDARVLVDAARRTGLRYGVMQNRRWQPNGIRRVRRMLDEGVIGEVHTLHSDFFLGPHFGGFREEMDHVLLLDMAIHSFDQIRFLLDAPPETVWARDWNPPGSWYQHGASAVAFFEHAGGARSSYRGSWCAEGMPESWNCTWRILGTRGTLLWDGEERIRVERVAGESAEFLRPVEVVEPPPAGEGELSGHTAAIHDFIEALLEDREPATPVADNLISLAMVHGAIRSAVNGETVSIQELIRGR